MNPPIPKEFQNQLIETADIVNSRLEKILSNYVSTEFNPRPERLIEAMHHGTLLGGKRLRPFLFMESTKLFSPSGVDPLNAACAIELVHCYSLIHDDLPAMDNDELRRGYPTVHKAFDEATAILAGDALLTLAFGILADADTHTDFEIRLKLISGLASASGIEGMAGGQMLDLSATELNMTDQQVSQMQKMKTGELIRFACEGGSIFCSASEDDIKLLRLFGEKIGLAYQISDDLLDVVGTSNKLGKATGKDEHQGKATLVSRYGIDWAFKTLKKLENEAVDILKPFGTKADALCHCAKFISEREN